MDDDLFSNIKSIKNEITFNFDSSEDAKIVYDSISIELETSPDYRSIVHISHLISKIILNIESKDLTSYRASINSVVKWINLVMDIRDLVN
ncbi:KEOPS complex subunit Pcc1 [Methanobrevibacter curvatus]|uniref:Transcription factor Pcc1 n=1 Tax=Methanobrevibacter curvatus TaxID=49547 RepID=A0A165YYV0_9EURY|nr:KEOPS complex subunit Pcc1 [Methanobrevibacter curvatus]KZX10043.1 transcription factor Pcc1 [Methanobrevibacter curvatus]